MKLMIDLNVVLDVVQRRETFYFGSATVLSKIVGKEHAGCVPSHALTTLYYLVHRASGEEQANAVVDLLLSQFEIVPQDKGQFVRARMLAMPDFEDAALAVAAETVGCELILTRNMADFQGSPVQAMTPEEFLAQV
jgi:predicted nucleic acid-binding protein